MSQNTHFRCDWCEAVVIVDDEDALLDEGWLTVELGSEKRDFDSLPCVAKWAVSERAREEVEAARQGDEES